MLVDDKPFRHFVITRALLMCSALSAPFYVALAQGANDVANAIGSLAVIYFLVSTGTVGAKVPVPIWLLAFGGVGIACGIGMAGHRVMETIGTKITQLKKEMEDRQEDACQGITEEELTFFKETLSNNNDVPTLFDGAAALKELGLMEEAIAEFEKLLEFDYSKFDYSETDYSPIKIVCDYLTCMLDVSAPQDVVKEAYRVIYKQNIKEKETEKKSPEP